MNGLWIALGVVLAGFLIGLFGWSVGHTQGYCDALGGTPLNGYSCNVDGKVVEVR